MAVVVGGGSHTACQPHEMRLYYYLWLTTNDVPKSMTSIEMEGMLSTTGDGRHNDQPRRTLRDPINSN